MTLSTGCGNSGLPSTGTVQGAITMDGNPIQEGAVVSFLMAESGISATGITDADGVFEMRIASSGQIPIGHYQVAIQPPNSRTSTHDEVGKALLDGTFALAVEKIIIPHRFHNPATSDISFTVLAGENVFLCDLLPGKVTEK